MHTKSVTHVPGHLARCPSRLRLHLPPLARPPEPEPRRASSLPGGSLGVHFLQWGSGLLPPGAASLPRAVDPRRGHLSSHSSTPDRPVPQDLKSQSVTHVPGQKCHPCPRPYLVVSEARTPTLPSVSPHSPTVPGGARPAHRSAPVLQFHFHEPRRSRVQLAWRTRDDSQLEPSHRHRAALLEQVGLPALP